MDIDKLQVGQVIYKLEEDNSVKEFVITDIYYGAENTKFYELVSPESLVELSERDREISELNPTYLTRNELSQGYKSIEKIYGVKKYEMIHLS